MKCPKCGTENNDANNFCHVCGAKLSKDSDIEKKPKSPARTQKILVVLVIVLVIICVLFALLWMYSRQANVINEVIEQEDLSNEVTEISNEDNPIEESKDIVYDVNNLSEEQQNMYTPIFTLCYCYEALADEPHSWSDAGWVALSSLINDFGYSLMDLSDQLYAGNSYYTTMMVSESFLKECASAMYYDFNGVLPQIPEPTTPRSAIGVFEKSGDYYVFGLGDRGMDSRNFRIISWIEHYDGSCTVEVEEWDFDMETLCATYRFELVPNKYTESYADPIFKYSVKSYEQTYTAFPIIESDNDAANNYYILPDSDTRYYTESELSGLSEDQLRLARNEIYARHGRKFDSEDLQEYFDSQAWYHGTIEATDFSESMLNDCEKANIKIIESLEESGTEKLSPVTSFSFSDIDDKDFAYGSGVGSWATELTVKADGTFEGLAHNWDAYGKDLSGNEHNGVYYWCEFSGKFSEPQKVNDYTYSTEVEYLNFANDPGTEEFKDDILYEYTEPTGINKGDTFMIYLPGSPVAELPEIYVGWRGLSDIEYLSSYGLYNASEAAVFG